MADVFSLLGREISFLGLFLFPDCPCPPPHPCLSSPSSSYQLPAGASNYYHVQAKRHKREWYLSRYDFKTQQPKYLNFSKVWPKQMLFFISYIFGKEGRTELRGLHVCLFVCFLFSASYKDPAVCLYLAWWNKRLGASMNILQFHSFSYLNQVCHFLGHQRTVTCMILFQALWHNGKLSEWMIWVPALSWLD